MLRTAIKGMGIIRRVNIGYSSASLEASQAGRRASLEASQSGAGNNWLKKEGTYKGKKFSSICHFFGYQARGSLPSKSDCNYAYGARFSLSQQVENFQNTLNQLKNMMGEEELRSHLANSLVTMILGSNDYINNYLQPLFYSSSYIYTLTAFADLLIKLYTKQILDQLSWGISRHFSSATSQNIHIDWRSCGVLNKIRKQSIVRGKKCHSCYAMAATCTVEAVLKIQKGGELEELSVQELLDCSRGYGNYGCGGGRIHSCYKYIISNGISREGRRWML